MPTIIRDMPISNKQEIAIKEDILRRAKLIGMTDESREQDVIAEELRRKTAAPVKPVASVPTPPVKPVVNAPIPTPPIHHKPIVHHEQEVHPKKN